MNWRKIIPSIVTGLAMLCGFLSMVLTAEGLRTANQYPYFLRAAQLVMVAMVLDGLDGNLARKLKGQSEFGAELDTYVDMTAFGLAPAMLLFALLLDSGHSMWLRTLLPSAVVIVGVTRLARFKVKDAERGQGGYTGLPITANGGWIAMCVIVSEASGHPSLSLQSGPFAILFLVGVIAMTVLQVSNVKYPKPTKSKWALGICAILVVFLVCLGQAYKYLPAVIILALGLGYAILGPFFVMARERQRVDQ